MTQEEKDDFLSQAKIVEKYKKFAPMLRNTIGANLVDQALFATMVFQLEKMNSNIEKLIELQTKPVAKVKAEEVTKAK